ncbi:membrane protease subunit (stomatin/prohibitin family) [Dysgonomonas sp. PFB1-18]|uniref:SPFH domain-containing protein n=1 Tax=unclassified Dysgonomonas TaxID=2630389 RepID=UPI002476515D|nr:MULTISPECIES: SPFH domain-containing protein [unclassified Dysgonomonas]MDL2303315.1 SPFH domain-containing protein [Dysgonomonas sp. OttesenSCG-928-D17]MDH6309678.1 membrane protease subunit (stomatin/prohibitin family) [Dysgonomonas sp. PF1-14]MDH6339314.1 membrane protease subunit (stomatin/prohibitin family) [Dysgonomonas sp. PF1-16]MDH6380813.1 membrane protease subunit (stomatin/prohibitin family) [Dysgonomonas sp. PFB1-18]MDH6398309.1 membrane protease subunit (stomatin/prohibitin fa
MGLKNFFRKQLSTVIEWTNQSPDLLFYKIETPTDEIKNASKLIVSPGQGCILVYEGKVQDVITDEGTYFLESDNHPFITTFLKLRQMFESEHKMHIYYFRTAEILNIKWGTATPVKYVDAVYKFPIELGAYGNFSARIDQAQAMFTNIIGSKNRYTTSDLQSLISARIAPTLASYMAQAKYSYSDIDAHLADMSDDTKDLLNSTFSDLGFELTDFRIQATSFDDETKDRIDKIANMTAEALSAAEVGLDYVQLEKLRALRDAAKNEGGLAGAGLQVGAGLELSKSLMNQKDQVIADGATDDAVTRLKKLKMLLDEQIITQEEFDTKKKEILDGM